MKPRLLRILKVMSLNFTKGLRPLRLLRRPGGSYTRSLTLLNSQKQNTNQVRLLLKSVSLIPLLPMGMFVCMCVYVY